MVLFVTGILFLVVAMVIASSIDNKYGIEDNGESPNCPPALKTLVGSIALVGVVFLTLGSVLLISDLILKLLGVLL